MMKNPVVSVFVGMALGITSIHAFRTNKVVSDMMTDMRSDDMRAQPQHSRINDGTTMTPTSYDRPELACVDCPEFVNLPAKEKEDVLWQHVVSDDYANVKPENRPWVTMFEEGEDYKCYGKHLVRQQDEFVFDLDLLGYQPEIFSPDPEMTAWTPTPTWEPVTGQHTCPPGSFCTCSDDFPMGTAWVPTAARVWAEAKRALNGTMPMFFDRFSDVNPADNVKLIHSYGAVAKVKVVMTEEGTKANKELGYTGMFADGFEHGLFRLSIVTDFSKASTCGLSCKNAESFKPSLAIKMLRDGEISSNAVAQVNLGLGVGLEANPEHGIPGWENSLNFFKFTHATWLPAPTRAVAGVGAVVVNKLFSKAEESEEIAGVGIKELASVGAPGAWASQMKANRSVNAPKLVYFVPTDEMISMKFSDGDHDPRHDFLTIPEGTPLFKIVALAEGEHCLKNPTTPYYWETLPEGCVGAHLQTVVTRSPFVASDWGDRRLFFQHERLKTKTGKWARKMCQTKDKSELPDNSEFRMSSDLSRTCSQKCGWGMTEMASAGGCPYAYMENE